MISVEYIPFDSVSYSHLLVRVGDVILIVEPSFLGEPRICGAYKILDDEKFDKFWENREEISLNGNWRKALGDLENSKTIHRIKINHHVKKLSN